MLEETRWPEYAGAALRCGVRCCITLAYRPDGDAVTLSLFGARPRSLESGQLALAELLTAFGGAMMGNAAEYGDTQRAALELAGRGRVPRAGGPGQRHADAGARL